MLSRRVIRRWSPPPEPEKPAVPYVAGFTATITEHVAPLPFGGPPTLYPAIKIPYDTSDEFLKTITQAQLVATCPPIDSASTLNATGAKKKATLKITAPIAVKDGRGPQVVLCTIIPEGSNGDPFPAVAKIFDPLYYLFQNEYAPDRPVATTVEADSDYSIEAAAYEQLKKTGHTGAFAPQYYGTWSFNLPIRHAGVDRERQIRLVLMEHVDGICMRDLCYGDSPPDDFTQEHRLDVLARILDGSVRMRHSGVDQRDLLPRNIMLVLGKTPEGSPQAVDRVVLIDYNVSVVTRLSPEAQEDHQVTNLPENPIDDFWNDCLSDFGHWVPQEWQVYSARPQQEWLMERFGGESASQYEPVSRRLDLDAVRPEAPTPVSGSPVIPVAEPPAPLKLPVAALAKGGVAAAPAPAADTAWTPPPKTWSAPPKFLEGFKVAEPGPLKFKYLRNYTLPWEQANRRQ